LAGGTGIGVIGVLISYNDRPLIETTITSLLPVTNRIVAVDGRFSDFPGGSDFSTDGTLEYLESIEEVRVIRAAGLQEVEKRNQYLIGEVGDWYLHLDADEEWTGPLEIPDTDMGIVKLCRAKPIHYMDRVRLFRHVEGLHYEKKHYWLHDGEGDTFALLEKPGNKYIAARLENNLIIHHGEERLPERTMAKRQYYRILSKRENPIRETK
jgi:hypothetical protein